MQSVTAELGTHVVPTYGLGEPERNPVFFEKRVFQGSSGKVYPVPFIDKVYQDDPPEPVTYQSAHLENEFLRLILLPEIGGRIFLGQDKANADYDFFYRQDVIKPALVGLAGPWISGGVEFNWPQHHRPGTYLPADVWIEEEADGARTVWLSEHDPLDRLKGMHGIRIRPGSSLIELRGRLYNRTPLTRTFLWWANVAARVHDTYQSVFPTDVRYVADHAVRAMSSFPVANNDYYGIDYAARPDANDLRWYRNIPVPTSYMVCQTDFGFFGGYDNNKQGGFVHVADKHISPGKKQWTWGNHEFGWAWDRELTDTNGPYVELMAGVYTDNQPDFSYLLPYETKTFSQYWWPYQKVGPVQEANRDAAVRMVVRNDRRLELGLAVSRGFDDLRIIVEDAGTVLLDHAVSAAPDRPWRHDELRFSGDQESTLLIRVIEASGTELIAYRPVDPDRIERKRDVATEPPFPADIPSTDELYYTGEHLEQYRHPTRYPEAYWNEGLRRDPGDARCNLSLGRQALGRGQFDLAAGYLEAAVARLTFRHPNPETGEAHYYLGLSRRYQGREDEAYALLYKATWNGAWRTPAYYQLACICAGRGEIPTALAHLDASLDTNRLNNKAQVLKAILLRRDGETVEAAEVLNRLLEEDPLDHWARAELEAGTHGPALSPAGRNDAQTVLDIAFDYAEAGCLEEARAMLDNHHAAPPSPVAVPNPLERTQLTHYGLAWVYDRLGEGDAAAQILAEARALPPAYCFPSRLQEQRVLEWALDQPGPDRNAAYGLGNYCYDKKRHEEAIRYWERARKDDPGFATVHRNLGIAYWNTRRDGKAAREAYEMALGCDPTDSRLVAEYDQLRGKLGDPAEARRGFLEARRELVLQRDDATVQLAALYNQTGSPEPALGLLTGRTFHPWEGGEGKVLRQYTTAHILLGRAALDAGNAEDALAHFEQAMDTPDSLGEKYHPLQAKADVVYWQGRALRDLGREPEAVDRFTKAAEAAGDFQNMAVTAFSELSYYQAAALKALGRDDDARSLLEAMRAYAEAERAKPGQIEYFATSLPNLLVFEEDLDEAHQQECDRLLALAEKGLSPD